MAVLKKSSPWVAFYREVDALFKHDDDVFVVFDEENYELCIYVNGESKASAIDFMMPKAKVFGNITVSVKVIPANEYDIDKFKDMDLAEIAHSAFDGNDAVEDIVSFEMPFISLVYVVFEKSVVQYFDDNIGDINGNCSTLYETIAKNVFNDVGLRFCTSNI